MRKVAHHCFRFEDDRFRETPDVASRPPLLAGRFHDRPLRGSWLIVLGDAFEKRWLLDRKFAVNHGSLTCRDRRTLWRCDSGELLPPRQDKRVQIEYQSMSNLPFSRPICERPL